MDYWGLVTMVKWIMLAGFLSILAFNIGSIERHSIDDTLKNGQCFRVENIVNCESEYITVSVKYK